jgi:hypothetical protein
MLLAELRQTRSRAIGLEDFLGLAPDSGRYTKYSAGRREARPGAVHHQRRSHSGLATEPFGLV